MLEITLHTILFYLRIQGGGGHNISNILGKRLYTERGGGGHISNMSVPPPYILYHIHRTNTLGSRLYYEVGETDTFEISICLKLLL